MLDSKQSSFNNDSNLVAGPSSGIVDFREVPLTALLIMMSLPCPLY